MKIAYFEVVDEKTNFPIYARFGTEAEARELIAECKADPDGYPNPFYIRKTVCTVNKKYKTTRKDTYKITV